MSEKKGKKLAKTLSVEDLYQNKNFVPPKEKNLETIFEEPRTAKDGAPVLTSVRKYKRFLAFDPTEGKIHKRKLRAKKCVGKLPSRKRTRSSLGDKNEADCQDVSMYILEALGEDSDEESCESKDTVKPDQEQKMTIDSQISEQKLPTSEDNNKLQSIQDNNKLQSVQIEFPTDSEAVPSCELSEEATAKKSESKLEEKELNSSSSSCVVT